MRITSILAGVVVGFAVAITGCGGPVESEQPPAAEVVVSEGQSSEREVTAQQELCPLEWTCDYTHFYDDPSYCNTYCGGPCFQAHACNRACDCP
ncbi:hypothetical protein ACLESD_18145 [Pyxidicoccus sp. 3LFB2]